MKYICKFVGRSEISCVSHATKKDDPDRRLKGGVQCSHWLRKLISFLS